MDFFKNILGLPKHTAKELYKLGVESRKQGDTDAALNYFNEALKLDPYDPLIFFDRGNTYFQIRNLEAAIEDFSQAVALEPDLGKAF